MNITFEVLLDSKESLAKLASIGKLSPALKLRLARIVKQVNPELKTFQEKRQELLESLGTYSQEKGRFIFPTYKVEKDFQNSFREMQAEQVELRFDTFDLKDFEKLEEITALDLANLDWLFGGLEKEEAKAKSA